MSKIFVLFGEDTKLLLKMEEVIETVEQVYKEKSSSYLSDSCHAE